MPAVTLEPVTRDSLDAVLALDVAPHQAHLVASNAKSLAQAFFHQDVAWFQAVCVGGTPVGFVMTVEEALRSLVGLRDAYAGVRRTVLQRL